MASRVLLLVVACGVALLACAAASPFPSSCSGTTNELPVWSGDPTLVDTNSHGMKYRVDAVDPPLHVVHVYGTPYEMGFARGTLMKTEITNLIDDVFVYFKNEIDTYIHFLPPSWQQAVIKYEQHHSFLCPTHQHNGLLVVLLFCGFSQVRRGDHH